MKLIDYIQGRRKGKDAHHLEKEAMCDPFLSDAIEGFDSIPGDHIKDIQKLQQQIKTRSNTNRKNIGVWSAAACLLVLVSLGGYFVMMPERLHKNDMISQELQTTEEMSSYMIAEENEDDSLAEINHQCEPLLAEAPPADTPSPSQPAAAMIIREEVMNDIVMDNTKDQQQDHSMELQAIVESEEELEPIITEEVRAQSLARQKVETARSTAKFEPEPADGKEAFEKYITENRKEPDGACKGVQGEVQLKFSINKKGRPHNIEVIKSLCELSDKEAIRLLKKGPDWSPALTEATVIIQFPYKKEN